LQVADYIPSLAMSSEPIHTAERIGNYRIGKTLGEGAFAKVKAGVHMLTGHAVAIKMLFKAKIKEEYVWRNLHREAELMKKLNHPHILQLYEIIDTEHAYCLITELAEGGEVLDYIVAHGKLAERETKKLVRQMVSAVDAMHRAKVVHR
jgi:serine/threonine protein kinase